MPPATASHFPSGENVRFHASAPFWTSKREGVALERRAPDAPEADLPDRTGREDRAVGAEGDAAKPWFALPGAAGSLSGFFGSNELLSQSETLPASSMAARSSPSGENASAAIPSAEKSGATARPRRHGLLGAVSHFGPVSQRTNVSQLEAARTVRSKATAYEPSGGLDRRQLG